jgi:hypothetical protein
LFLRHIHESPRKFGRGPGPGEALFLLHLRLGQRAKRPSGIPPVDSPFTALTNGFGYHYLVVK